jgi:hypothetical protein
MLPMPAPAAATGCQMLIRTSLAEVGSRTLSTWKLWMKVRRRPSSTTRSGVTGTSPAWDFGDSGFSAMLPISAYLPCSLRPSLSSSVWL